MTAPQRWFTHLFRTGFLRFSFLVVLTLWPLQGGSPDGAPRCLAQGEAKDPVVLNLWADPEGGQLMSGLIDGFVASHPGVQVQLHTIPKDGLHEKYVTAAIGDSLPDLAPIPPSMSAEFMTLNLLEPLDPYLAESRIELGDFLPGVADSFRQGETWFGIPWHVATHLFFYRKDHLAEVGYQSFPTTWDDFHRLCAALKARHPERFPLMVRYDNSEILMTLFSQRGGDLLGEAGHGALWPQQALVDALSELQDWREKGWAPWGTELRPGKVRGFFEGYYSMLVQGPWVIWDLWKRAPHLNGQWGTARYPGQRKRTTILRPFGLVMFRSSKNKAWAWKLMEHFLSVSSQLSHFQRARSLPVTLAAWRDPALASEPLLQPFFEQLGDSRAAPFAPEFSAISDEMVHALEEIAVGGTTPASAAFQLRQRVGQVMDKSSLWQPLVWRVALALVVLNGLFLATVFYLRRGTGSRTTHLRKPQGMGFAWSQLEWLRLRGALPFLFPALLVLMVFHFLPIAWSFLASLTNWDIYGIADVNRVMFVGLENYRALWHDAIFWQAFRNTLVIFCVGAPLRLLLALLIALALHNHVRRYQAVWRLGFFVPVVTTLAAASLIWRWLFQVENGPFGALLAAIGLPHRSLLEDPTLALLSLIVVSVWKGFGYDMVIFLVARQGIDESLYEAADLDGAGDWQKFRHITLPALIPALVFSALITGIGYLQVFAEPYIVTRGGPGNATLSIVLYLYRKGFKFFQFGYASAIAFALLGAILVLALFRHVVKTRLLGEPGGTPS